MSPDPLFTEFTLHPKLHADTLPVAELPLCKLLLMNDSQYPWLILVPRQPNLRDLTDVPPENRAQMFTEVMAVEHALKLAANGYKMNVAALSNVVQQLHIHVVARFEADAAWPAPVWGKHPAKPYQPSEAGQLIARVKAHLAAQFPDSI